MSRSKAKNYQLCRSGHWPDQARRATQQPIPQPKPFGGSYLDALREESRRNIARIETSVPFPITREAAE